LRTFCLGWPPTRILQISTSQEARIPGLNHYCAQLGFYFLVGVVLEGSRVAWEADIVATIFVK
jgi:hypothetical protein